MIYHKGQILKFKDRKKGKIYECIYCQDLPRKNQSVVVAFYPDATCVSGRWAIRVIKNNDFVLPLNVKTKE